MLRSHLLDSLKRYLDQEASLQELGEWLLSHLQEVLDSGDQDTIRLANQVDADLVEFNEGLIDEATLREHLDSYVRLQQTLSFTFPEVQPCPSDVQTATGVKTITDQVQVPGAVETIRLDVGLVSV